MKKWKASGVLTINFGDLEIEAENIGEAYEKFYKMSGAEIAKKADSFTETITDEEIFQSKPECEGELSFNVHDIEWNIIDNDIEVERLDRECRGLTEISDDEIEKIIINDLPSEVIVKVNVDNYTTKSELVSLINEALALQMGYFFNGFEFEYKDKAEEEKAREQFPNLVGEA